VIYGNALWGIRVEGERAADPVGAASPGRRRRRSAARGLDDLAWLVEQMESVVAEFDRLRQAVDQILAL